MKTYYILDSTIFNKAEDMVKALFKGETILNDDANLAFSIKGSKIMIEHRLSGQSAFMRPKSYNANHIAELMDTVVEKFIKAGSFDDMEIVLFNLV